MARRQRAEALARISPQKSRGDAEAAAAEAGAAAPKVVAGSPALHAAAEPPSSRRASTGAVSFRETRAVYEVVQEEDGRGAVARAEPHTRGAAPPPVHPARPAHPARSMHSVHSMRSVHR